MSHLDDETLAAIALGEHEAPSDLDHATMCRACASRLAELTGTRARLDALAASGGLQLPPAHVWEAIRSQTVPSDSDELATRRRRGQRATPRWQVGVAAAAGLVVGGAG